MASRRKNVLSTLIALICWIFIQNKNADKSIAPPETFTANRHVCINRLTESNIQLLKSDEWCIIVGDSIEIPDNPPINLAFLNLRTAEDARVAARLHLRSINSLIYCKDGQTYVKGEWKPVYSDANWVENFDTLMFIILYRTRSLLMNKIVIMGIFEASVSNLIRQAVLHGY